ncbi:FecR family protein [Brevundimonas subvibrioides]|uniref:Anti-FecI sigma factor, FecR n=1 Tax=Brevundimonas subvibrioides (strain ATCC 15264 / DSM 4735 / LMG 14903 / NBRC 16000 / CB 81) TaxID=633149 RepID=D9QEZ5_BRESC|nr:FecR domain-containing protein [Brevundimonas subvibrioides]ADL00480.1 anti-FecI sigma factor, FecR [Brevundimonas subvibrioides ATCC 15264]
MTDVSVHDQAIRWFVALRDESADEGQWLAFQGWLEADADHPRAYDAVERMWLDLDEAEAAPDVVAPSPSPRRARPSGRPSVTRRLVPAFAIAASLVLAAGLWLNLSGRPQTFVTTDATRVVVLDDGSSVHLNRHSRMSVRMTDDQRMVTLDEGEAAFDVVHRPDRPFVVRSGEQSVRVLGTAFDVLSHKGRYRVAVQRGAVAVDAGAGHDDTRLRAGQSIERVGLAPPVLSTISPDAATSWTQGTLIYRNASLSTVADDLSRYLDKPVIVGDPAKRVMFTGVLQVGDEATMARQLEDLLPIRVSRSSTEVRLTARGEG